VSDTVDLQLRAGDMIFRGYVACAEVGFHVGLMVTNAQWESMIQARVLASVLVHQGSNFRCGIKKQACSFQREPHQGELPLSGGFEECPVRYTVHNHVRLGELIIPWYVSNLHESL
jgi:hypothetical protein